MAIGQLSNSLRHKEFILDANFKLVIFSRNSEKIIFFPAIDLSLDRAQPDHITMYAKIKDWAFYISQETIKLIKLKGQIRRQAQKTQDPELKNLYNQLDTLVKKQYKMIKEKNGEKPLSS